jgi:hypothetical protein
VCHYLLVQTNLLCWFGLPGSRNQAKHNCNNGPSYCMTSRHNFQAACLVRPLGLAEMLLSTSPRFAVFTLVLLSPWCLQAHGSGRTARGTPSSKGRQTSGSGGERKQERQPLPARSQGGRATCDGLDGGDGCTATAGSSGSDTKTSLKDRDDVKERAFFET